MSEVCNFLNSLVRNDGCATTWLSPEQALDKLKEQYGIKYNHDDGYNLYILNYDQIDSSKVKDHPIVRECRSLVLSFNDFWGNFKVASRSFDRFFNYTEHESAVIEDGMEFYEKLDGSLISVFYYAGQWHWRTKSMLNPYTHAVDSFEHTWGDLFNRNFNLDVLDSLGMTSSTFIFEMCCKENQVVVKYPEDQFKLLAIRHNQSGAYVPSDAVDVIAEKISVGRPKRYTLQSADDVVNFVAQLRDLDEGVVGYLDSVPVVKVKNPAYVAAHHLRGEGLNPKRILDLIIMEEIDEYLSVFPDEEELVQPYIKAYNKVWSEVSRLWRKHRHIEDQKAFAQAIAKSPVSGIIFNLRKGIKRKTSWENMLDSKKRKIIMAFVERGER